MFHPGAMALNTIAGVIADALTVEIEKASLVTLTLTLSPPKEILTVPLPASVVLLAAAETTTVVL